MRKFRFDKLVRDKIPADMQREGSMVSIIVLDNETYLTALKDKLLEEASEISVAVENRSEALKEVADLQEVIDCMVTALDAVPADVEAIQNAKRSKCGSFRDRLYIRTITVNDDIPWIKHYTSNPDRYPEIT